MLICLYLLEHFLFGLQLCGVLRHRTISSGVLRLHLIAVLAVFPRKRIRRVSLDTIRSLSQAFFVSKNGFQRSLLHDFSIYL